MVKNPLIVIVGPTAVGKTEMSIRLAGQLKCEIISADSRQLYKFMDIGTAKPTKQEQQQAVHWLIDVIEPDEAMSLALYQSMANDCITSVYSHDSIPVLAGGTGQYVKAVTEGWGIPQVAPNHELRESLLSFSEVYGPEPLHGWLAGVDPIAAAKIDYRNVRRVIRALEVFLETGKPISEHQERKSPPYSILTIGLTRSRERLYERVDQRVDSMVREGLLDEISWLLSRGYGWENSSLSSLGYIQFADYFANRVTLEEAIWEVKSETRRFIRQQYTWFRLDDPSVHWFDLDAVSADVIITLVSEFLKR